MDRHERSDAHVVLRVLRRRAWLIILALILTVGAATGFSLAQRKVYSASASLLFRDPGLDQKLFGTTSLSSSSDPQREAATNVRLVSLEVVAARAAHKLDGGLSADAVQSKISVAQQGQSDVVSVTATDESPRFAATLANTFAAQYIAFRRDADRAKIKQAQDLVQRQLSRLSPSERANDQGRTLSDRAEQLDILASLQTGNAELVQPAQAPSAPSSPKPVRNAILGGVLGLILGIALAVLLERLDRRIKDPEDLEEAYRLPVLGAVPKSRGLAGTKQAPRLDATTSEAFAMLRAKLRYFNVDREIRSILVTSAEPRDGKSTVAWYIADSATRSGRTKVLLIEADLRRPSLARQHGISPMPGLAELLTHDLELADVLQQLHTTTANGAAAAEFDIIVAGALPPNPAELLESHKMAELLDYLSQVYDLVVIDTPPTAVVSDAIPLMTQVSGVLVVGRLGKTSRDTAARLRDQLAGLHVNTLGLVANDLNLRAQGHYYGYRYGYGDYVAQPKGDTVVSRRPTPVVAPAPNGNANQATEERERVGSASSPQASEPPPTGGEPRPRRRGVLRRR